MASVLVSPSSFDALSGSPRWPRSSSGSKGKGGRRTLKWGAIRAEKSLEELYNIQVERKVSAKRLGELKVSRWSVWKTGKCTLPWDWHVDQVVYIEQGEVRVVPEGSERFMRFEAGDLVRYPKWFEADLWFNDYYQERYTFKAYGDD